MDKQQSFYGIFRHEGLKFGWKHAKKDFWFFFQMFVLIAVVSYIPALVQLIVWDSQEVLVIAISFVCQVLAIIFTFGMIKIFLHFVHEKAHKLSDLWDHKWVRVGRWIVTKFLAGILIAIGFVLLIIPGIYVAARLYLAEYFVVDQNMNAIEAISASREITKWHVREIIGIWLLTLGITILGVIPAFIGLLWTVPTVKLAQATLYKKLTAHAKHIE